MTSEVDHNLVLGGSTPSSQSQKKSFKVLKVWFDVKAEGSHCLYLKPHKLKKEMRQTRPQGRTLFVNNVPPYCSEAVLKRIFKQFGKIQRVELCNSLSQDTAEYKPSEFFDGSDKPKGFRCGYVVFEEAASLTTLMGAQFKSRIDLSSASDPIPVGLEAMIAEYNKSMQVDYSRVQTEIKEFMENFDEKEFEAEEKAKQTQDQADDEGWTVVSKNRGAPRTEARQIQTSQRSRRKQKQMELINFYSFQMRETKRDQLAELRKKFDADKQRIALMRSQRKFKPY